MTNPYKVGDLVQRDPAYQKSDTWDYGNRVCVVAGRATHNHILLEGIPGMWSWERFIRAGDCEMAADVEYNEAMEALSAWDSVNH
jgi:hypothetical protein